MYRIGIDLGGTNIAVGVVDDHHRIVAEASLPAGAHRPAENCVCGSYSAECKMAMNAKS